MTRRPVARRSPETILAALALLAAGLTAACDRTSVVTQRLDPERLRWRTYTDRTLAYSIDYPEGFEMQVRDDGEAQLRVTGVYSTDVPARVVHATEEEARRRGLWARKFITGPATLGGRQGERYVYTHSDGPFYSRTVAYVVPHRGKMLGLEFRAEGDLDRVQQRMLASFRLPAESPQG